jgi:myo-inositol catabolism protein IolC
MNTQPSIPTGLYVLPFDHQNSLYKLFGWQLPLSPEQESVMRKTRMVTYEGYLQGVALGVPQTDTAILTDDLYGDEVLARAASDHTPVIYTLEKSGQEILTFAHDNWQEIVLEKNPTWIKTLVRYNPTADSENLRITRQRLKQVSDFAREHGYGFMIEPLVIPTEEQKTNPDFDHVMRPELTVHMLREIYEADIYPTIWKIEGLDTVDFYNHASDTIQHYDASARIVVLGRSESITTVKQWLSAGAQNPMVIGFAIGRTVFADALLEFIRGNITDKEAITIIANNYYELYTTFIQAKNV